LLNIDKTSIVPFFQPIVCVDTCDIFGYEVLADTALKPKYTVWANFFTIPVYVCRIKFR
jgi:hypothetical protein